jgi:hypothetical protein
MNFLQYRISNVKYNITSGTGYPVPDKSAPVYITVGDGGNQEGLASKYEGQIWLGYVWQFYIACSLDLQNFAGLTIRSQTTLRTGRPVMGIRLCN